MVRTPSNRQGGDRGGLEPPAGQVRPGAGESAGLLGVVRQPGEERLAVVALGGGLASADGVDEVAERCVVRFHEHDGHIAHRAGLVAGQRPPERSQGKDAGLGLGEHAHAGQRPQQPAQRRRVCAGAFGQDLSLRRASQELIGHAEHRGGIQRLGDPEPAQEQDHLRGRRKFVCLHGAPFGGPGRIRV